MTQMELQIRLGELFNRVMDDTANNRERAKNLENAEFGAKIAKQMINNADIVLRADKLCGKHERIDKIVGEPDAS